MSGRACGPSAAPGPGTRRSHWAYCLSDPSALSGLAYFAVTDGLDPVAGRCFDAIRTRLQLLDLPVTRLMYDLTYVQDPTLEWPHAALTADRTTDPEEGALNGRDDYAHPVRVLLRDKVFKFDQTMLRPFLAWRQAVARAFHNQCLPGVSESVRCKVAFGPVLTPTEKDPTLSSELTVRCITREPRGLGA